MNKILVVLGITFLSLNQTLAFTATSYKQVYEVQKINVADPTIVEIVGTLPLGAYILVDQNNNETQLQFRQNKQFLMPLSVEVCKNSSACEQAPEILDGNQNTTYDFFLTNPGLNQGSITVNYAEPVTSENVFFQTVSNSYKPDTFSLYVDGRLILDNVDSAQTTFPKISGKVFKIDFKYTKPIRFSEAGAGYNTINNDAIRFVYTPNANYKLYAQGYKAENTVFSQTDLFLSTRVSQKVNLGYASSNQSYKANDTDADGVADDSDNCRLAANNNQSDSDNNGIGDACDDYDYDGIATYLDNCPDISNTDQIDTDSDKKGDACDGQESRLTEKYYWLQWGVLALVLLSFMFLGYKVYQSTKLENTQK